MPIRLNLVRIIAGGKEIGKIETGKFPAYARVGFSLSHDKPDFVIIDANGAESRFDLGSALEDGFDWVDAVIEINSDLVVFSDCRLGKGGVTPSDCQQIKFQPVLLPGNNIMNNLMGKGIYTRGFFANWQSGQNLSLICLCDECRRSFRVETLRAPEMQTYF